MHSWRDVLDLLEAVGQPQTVGFQADLAHTYLYLMGYNAAEYALLDKNYSPHPKTCGTATSLPCGDGKP